jgi:hypothetical protein
MKTNLCKNHRTQPMKFLEKYRGWGGGSRYVQ